MARLFRCLMSTDKNAIYVSSFTKLFRRSCHERSCLNPTDGLSTDDKEIYEHALSFAKNEMAPYMKEWDLNQTFPRDTLQHAAQLGFGAICCKDTYGGSNLGRLQASIIFEALAQGCPSTTAYLSIHNMCAWMIDTFGNEDLRKKWMPNLAKMENFASYCLTEPDSGSDSASLKTSIVKKSNEYVINGTKWKLHKVMSCKDGGFIRDDGNKGGSMQLSFISGAGESSVYLVMGRTGCEGPKGISCVLVEADRKGLSYGKKEEKVGWCTHPARQVFLEDVVVPTSNLLGKENKGFHIAMDGLNGGRVNIASVSLGAATAALDAVKEHLGIRKQFGKSLKDFQYLQFKFAEMATSVVASRLMVRHAAKSLESKSPNYVPLASMAKLFVTEQCSKVCDDAIQMFGGYGYLKEYPVQQYYRDARLHHIIEGTNEMMRLLISRNVLSS